MSRTSSPGREIPRQILRGGGSMWLSKTSYHPFFSLRHSTSGIQEGTSKELSTGFCKP